MRLRIAMALAALLAGGTLAVVVSTSAGSTSTPTTYTTPGGYVWTGPVTVIGNPPPWGQGPPPATLSASQAESLQDNSGTITFP
jgi:hypothetical protein